MKNRIALTAMFALTFLGGCHLMQTESAPSAAATTAIEQSAFDLSGLSHSASGGTGYYTPAPAEPVEKRG